ncbi:MAG TPA: OsmC family protein [Thermoanaerobaculia bacterium]|nr:OsmC family protein [Thermoanaerobaculia bacterium]
MDLKSLQRPFKERYRSDPSSSKITLRAGGGQTETPLTCSVDIGRAVYAAQAHAGTGGPGTGACSGDLLLGALAACAQITCQLVAEALGIAADRIAVSVEGDLDLRGTLGVSREVPVGFDDIRVRFDVSAPNATAEQLETLREKTEQYCVVLQTLVRPPAIRSDWGPAA